MRQRQNFFEETIDVNQDGFLDHNELRTLAARTIGTPLARNDMASLVCFPSLVGCW